MLSNLPSLVLGTSLLTFTQLACANTQPKVVHEHRASAPPGWSQTGRVDPNAPLNLRIGLTQQNLEKAEVTSPLTLLSPPSKSKTPQAYILSVSDPKSPTYGKHWTPEQIASTFAPSPATASAVTSWLLSSGFATHAISPSSSGGWLNINTTFAEAEALLEAEYHVYEHAETGTTHVATQSYSLPRVLAGKHVDMVLPSVHFDVRPVKAGARGVKTRQKAPAQPVASGKGKGTTSGPRTKVVQ
jgi:tripeptidyl-peptidase-1